MTSDSMAGGCPVHGKTPPVADLSPFGIGILDIEGMADPYPVYRHLRDMAPVVAIEGHGLTYYHVNGWDAAFEALRDPRFSKDQAKMAAAAHGHSGPEAGFVISSAAKGNLLNTDAPEHTRLRKLVSQAFSPTQIRLLEFAIAEVVEDRLAQLSGRETADIVADYAYPIAITMICRILGVPASDQDRFRVWATAASTPHIALAGDMDQATGAALLKEYLAERIAVVRRAIVAGEPSQDGDLLTAMAQAQEAGDPLSDEELLSMAFLLLIAGHETTVGLISATLVRLARNPDQRQLLIDRPELIGNAMEEFLRMDGSVQRTTFRFATEDVEIGGMTIPAGAITVIALPTANRDPARFDDPEKFDISRPIRPNLAFGMGAHFCLGSNLARNEVRIAVDRFVRRFPDYTVGEPTWARTIIRAPLVVPTTLGREVLA